MPKPQLEERVVPFFEDKEKGIKFIPNPRDEGAYQVVIGDKGHFYLPDGMVRDLSHPLVSTEELERKLGWYDPTIPIILKDNYLTYKDLHIAILAAFFKSKSKAYNPKL